MQPVKAQQTESGSTTLESDKDEQIELSEPTTATSGEAQFVITEQANLRKPTAAYKFSRR